MRDRRFPYEWEIRKERRRIMLAWIFCGGLSLVGCIVVFLGIWYTDYN